MLPGLPKHPAQPCRFMTQAFSPGLLLGHQTLLLVRTPLWEWTAGGGAVTAMGLAGYGLSQPPPAPLPLLPL